MSRFFNIIFIPPENGPTRQLRVRKWMVLAGAFSVFLISFVGYFLLFTGVLDENPFDAEYRKKIARTNLKLTQRILSLKESQKNHSSELSEIESRAHQMMQASGIYLKSEKAKQEKSAGKVLLNSHATGNLTNLFDRAHNIDLFLKNALDIITQNVSQLDFLPTHIPVKTSAFIVREFGKVKDPFSGKLSYHTGVDFSGQQGDSVWAPANGTVKRIRYDPFYGKTIRISHNSNTETFFAHLQSIVVKTGQKVTRGQLLGELGSTGKTTGPHLHYEILVDGEKINPQGIFLTQLESPFLLNTP